jgi:hypothetical protein
MKDHDGGRRAAGKHHTNTGSAKFFHHQKSILLLHLQLTLSRIALRVSTFLLAPASSPAAPSSTKAAPTAGTQTTSHSRLNYRSATVQPTDRLVDANQQWLFMRQDRPLRSLRCIGHKYNDLLVFRESKRKAAQRRIPSNEIRDNHKQSTTRSV